MSMRGITIPEDFTQKEMLDWESLANTLPKNSNVVIGLPSSMIAYQKITLHEPLPKKEMEQFLSSQLSHHLNLPIDQLAWDYDIIADTNPIEISAIATEKTLIKKITSAFSHMKIKAIEPITYGIARLIIKKKRQNDFLMIIRENSHFLHIVVKNQKIAHYEKGSLAQLINTHSQNKEPRYFINITNQGEENGVLQDAFENIMISAEEALSTWSEAR